MPKNKNNVKIQAGWSFKRDIISGENDSLRIHLWHKFKNIPDQNENVKP